MPLLPLRRTASESLTAYARSRLSDLFPDSGENAERPAGIDWTEPKSRWLPQALRGALVNPGRRGLAALVAVMLLAAALAGWAAWRSRPVAEPAEQLKVVPSRAAATAQLVVVAVAGKVRRPGLVRLPAGSRVADAVAAAGGALPGTDLTSVNLARKLVDGEQIIVGTPTAAAGAAPKVGPVNLNTATAEQLDALPGVGPVLAKRIVDYRAQHGPFGSVEQLREVSGIGAAKFASLRGQVTV
ncbi:ComEA family DNA-binding protein [Fodinicola acaciae]|uniref:ComEA family DNA-binding protein n=1 Tax=Fodinicola acaciae TaxID=2681555 RepID=UPI001FE31E23|nr:ComEA family DNA-binding protein [Fodinicola acaciae]